MLDDLDLSSPPGLFGVSESPLSRCCTVPFVFVALKMVGTGGEFGDGLDFVNHDVPVVSDPVAKSLCVAT